MFKTYYLRTETKPIPELKFNSFTLAKEVAIGLCRNSCIGSYASLYVVRSVDDVAVLHCWLNNIDTAPNRSF